MTAALAPKAFLLCERVPHDAPFAINSVWANGPPCGTVAKTLVNAERLSWRSYLRCNEYGMTSAQLDREPLPTILTRVCSVLSDTPAAKINPRHVGSAALHDLFPLYSRRCMTSLRSIHDAKARVRAIFCSAVNNCFSSRKTTHRSMNVADRPAAAVYMYTYKTISKHAAPTSRFIM